MFRVIAILLSFALLHAATCFQAGPQHVGTRRAQWARTWNQPPAMAKNSEDTEIPSMDWLTDSLKESEDPSKMAASSDESRFIQEMKTDDEQEEEGVRLESPIPQSGISVMDEMDAKNRDRFQTDLFPIKGLEPGVEAAEIITTASSKSFEPIRYIVRLSKTEVDGSDANDEASKSNQDIKHPFVIVDVPPFSELLVAKIRKYMARSGKGSHLVAMLVTSKDAIHYDEAPAMYTMRRADLGKWKAAFPDLVTVCYRMDAPRDCRKYVTQILDGYSPHAWDEDTSTFVETGRPLVVNEWDHDLIQDVMTRGKMPPVSDEEPSDAHLYTPEAIREREEGKRILAIYTPGRTFGSISYIFPELGLCCSGYTIPVEDNRESNVGLDRPGPILDCRGFVTTSKAGISKQMKSARELINTYGDRFSIVLPSSGGPLRLRSDVELRKKDLIEIIDQYEKIGLVYEQLGITTDSEED